MGENRNTSIRFTEAERVILRQAADQLGMGWTTFTRETALICAQEMLANSNGQDRTEHENRPVHHTEALK